MDNSNPSTIAVTINGETREVPEGLTVKDLLAHLDLHERMVVVEKNREIVRREDYGGVGVDEGDAFELVHFVGGG
jgi:thiamine biosynthesis protein ThiS